MTLLITSDPYPFFEILPSDWVDSIEPYWQEYVNTTDVAVLLENEIIVAGGLLFNQTPPELLPVEDRFEKYFDAGYLHIGFLWVPEVFRDRNYGSEWIRQVKNHYKNREFWLSIEEPGLEKFYRSNGFVADGSYKTDGREEWVFVSKPVRDSE